jgi:predicted Zn-dependent peptidase
MADEEFPIVERRLDNGLRVIVSEDHNAPAVAVNIWYDVGSRHEQPGRTGFAHLFEHLMFQGSANVGPSQHFELLEAVGATLNATTSFDRTNYFETVPTSALDLALWLEADRMASLTDALTLENLDNQRDVVKNERRQRYETVPYGTAWERLFSMVFPEGHPYHHMPIGSMADLDAASLEDAHRFFRTHYAPGNAVLTIVGDVAADDALRAAARYFDAVPAGAPAPPPRDGAIGPITTEVRADVDEKVPARALYALYRMPADGTVDAEAADLVSAVVGEGASSRLARRLVRREQLAQAVDFGVLRLIGGVSVATLVVQASGDADLAHIEEIVDEEIGGLEITADDLDRAKAQHERHWLEQTSDFGGRADEISRFATLFDDPRQINEVVARSGAVTVEEAAAVAAEWLRPEARALLRYVGEPVAEGAVA